MEDIKNIAITRAIKQLTVMGCKFKIIGDDGSVISDTLPEPKPKIKREHNKVEKACAYKEKLQNIKPGEVVTISANDHVGVKEIQASVTSFMASHFGNGSYISQRSKDGNSVTVLRVE